MQALKVSWCRQRSEDVLPSTAAGVSPGSAMFCKPSRPGQLLTQVASIFDSSQSPAEAVLQMQTAQLQVLSQL